MTQENETENAPETAELEAMQQASCSHVGMYGFPDHYNIYAVAEGMTWEDACRKAAAMGLGPHYLTQEPTGRQLLCCEEQLEIDGTFITGKI